MTVRLTYYSAAFNPSIFFPCAGYALSVVLPSPLDISFLLNLIIVFLQLIAILGYGWLIVSEKVKAVTLYEVHRQITAKGSIVKIVSD